VKKIKSTFEQDYATVQVGSFGLVYVEVIDGVYNREAELQMTPKQARKFAKALKRAARAAKPS
jgi:hypothetical protein